MCELWSWSAAARLPQTRNFRGMRTAASSLAQLRMGNAFAAMMEQSPPRLAETLFDREFDRDFGQDFDQDLYGSLGHPNLSVDL